MSILSWLTQSQIKDHLFPDKRGILINLLSCYKFLISVKSWLIAEWTKTHTHISFHKLIVYLSLCVISLKIKAQNMAEKRRGCDFTRGQIIAYLGRKEGRWKDIMEVCKLLEILRNWENVMRLKNYIVRKIWKQYVRNDARSFKFFSHFVEKKDNRTF